MKKGQIIALLITLIILVIFVYYFFGNVNKSAKYVETEVVAEYNGLELEVEEMVVDISGEYISGESYICKFDEKDYDIENINVPYFTFKSKSADTANAEMKEVYNKLYAEFKENLSGDHNSYVDTRYDMYRKPTNILSVLLTIKRVKDGEKVDNEYYAYAFNLNDFSFMPYEAISRRIKLPEEDVLNEFIKKAIRNSTYLKNLDDDVAREYVDKTFNNYTKDVKDKNVCYVVDGVGRLNIIMDVQTPDGPRQDVLKIKLL